MFTVSVTCMCTGGSAEEMARNDSAAVDASLIANLAPGDKIPLPRDKSSDNESYAQIIARAIWAHPGHIAQTKELYNWIFKHYPRFRNGPRFWKNSIRHTLSKYNCFVRTETDSHVSWSLNPKLLTAAHGVAGENGIEDAFYLLCDKRREPVSSRCNMYTKWKAPEGAGDDPGDAIQIKPKISYVQLVARAIWDCPSRKAKVEEIYCVIISKFPYFRNGPRYWKNSVRHTLSTNKLFQGVKSNDMTGFAGTTVWSLSEELYKQMQMEMALEKEHGQEEHGQIPRKDGQKEFYVTRESLEVKKGDQEWQGGATKDTGATLQPGVGVPTLDPLSAAFALVSGRAGATPLAPPVASQVAPQIAPQTFYSQASPASTKIIKTITIPISSSALASKPIEIPIESLGDEIERLKERYGVTLCAYVRVDLCSNVSPVEIRPLKCARKQACEV